MTRRTPHRAISLVLGIVLLVPGMTLAKKPKPYDRVTVTYNQQLAAECTYLGDVEATSIWGGFFDKVGRNRAKKALRKRAHKMGGDLVVVAQRPGHQGFVSYGAMVFACPVDENGVSQIQKNLDRMAASPAPGQQEVWGSGGQPQAQADPVQNPAPSGEGGTLPDSGAGE